MAGIHVENFLPPKLYCSFFPPKREYVQAGGCGGGVAQKAGESQANSLLSTEPDSALDPTTLRS